MLSTLLVVGVISHLWCAARLVGKAHHSFYSVHLPFFCLHCSKSHSLCRIDGYSLDSNTRVNLDGYTFLFGQPFSTEGFEDVVAVMGAAIP